MTKYGIDYINEWLGKPPRQSREVVTHDSSQYDRNGFDLYVIRRMAELAIRHMDMPGIPKAEHGPLPVAAPMVRDAKEMGAFLMGLVAVSADEGTWKDVPFWCDAYIVDEIGRHPYWREVERVFAARNKRPAIERLHGNYWMVKGNPYWLVAIRTMCSTPYLNGYSSAPVITF